MKYLFYTWKLGCLLLLVFAGCSSKKSVSSYHSFESECLGVEPVSYTHLTLPTILRV